MRAVVPVAAKVSSMYSTPPGTQTRDSQTAKPSAGTIPKGEASTKSGYCSALAFKDKAILVLVPDPHCEPREIRQKKPQQPPKKIHADLMKSH